MGNSITPVDPRIAEHVRIELANHGLSQRELAEKLGWHTQQRLSRRLTGQVSFTVEELIEVSQAIGCPFRSLVWWLIDEPA